MRRLFFLFVYNLFFPLFLLLALPSYLIKMKRRGGVGTGLLERFGVYHRSEEEEPKGGIYVHAVSVGEVMLALKFIREWRKCHPEEGVALATSTSTGHEVARHAGLPHLRVLYAPLDLPFLSGRCLRRFQPKCVVLVEAELWPNFSRYARRVSLPVVMINARLSPRSERRYARFPRLSRLLFSGLSGMGVQSRRDVGRFARIGVDTQIIRLTGSIKFDVIQGEKMAVRSDFRAILAPLSAGRPIVLAASTHKGEELIIAEAARRAGAFPLIVPRHAERRDEVVRELTAAGFRCILRSRGEEPESVGDDVCYIVDTTGELREWTALASVAVIGKSFLAVGGQNPVEAIAAGVPVIVGPDMSNFEDLISLLLKNEGIVQCSTADLAENIRYLFDHEDEAAEMAGRAFNALRIHSGATERSVSLVESCLKSA